MKASRYEIPFSDNQVAKVKSEKRKRKGTVKILMILVKDNSMFPKFRKAL